MLPPVVDVTVGPGLTVEFRNSASGKVTRFPTDAQGRIHASVPQGDYEIVAGSQRRNMTLLPAGSYSVDLRPERNIDLRLSQETDANGVVRVTATISGAGPHHIRALAEGLGRHPEGSKYSADMSKHAFFGTDSKIKAVQTEYRAKL